MARNSKPTEGTTLDFILDTFVEDTGTWVEAQDAYWECKRGHGTDSDAVLVMSRIAASSPSEALTTHANSDEPTRVRNIQAAFWRARKGKPIATIDQTEGGLDTLKSLFTPEPKE